MTTTLKSYHMPDGTVTTYAVGDILVFTERSNQGWSERLAVVTGIEFTPGMVLYAGCQDRLTRGSDIQPTGQGAFDPTTVGTKKYGFHMAVRLFHRQPMRTRTQREQRWASSFCASMQR